MEKLFFYIYNSFHKDNLKSLKYHLLASFILIQKIKMGCCCKKRAEPINIVVSSEHFIEKKEEDQGNKLISLEDFEILKLIGKGSFAKVYLVRKKSNQKLFSMKKLNKPFIKNYKQEQHTINERILLSKMNYPFLVKLYCAFQDKENLYFIMEFIQGGELFFHLHRETRFDDEKTRFYVAELILALNFLHKNKIIYRDIKPENILLDKDGHIKLTDFGLSRICSEKNEKAFTICGTPFYIAPEIIEKKGYNDSVDWWSLGCLMYEMLFGRPLFNFSNSKIDKNEYKKPIQFYNCFSEEAKDLIGKLVELDPKKRIGAGPDGFENLKNHKYFESIDWDELENRNIKAPFIPNLNSSTDLQYFDKIFTDEINITKESDELDNTKMTVDNYVNFSYYDPNNSSFKDKDKVKLLKNKK